MDWQLNVNTHRSLNSNMRKKRRFVRVGEEQTLKKV